MQSILISLGLAECNLVGSLFLRVHSIEILWMSPALLVIVKLLSSFRSIVPFSLIDLYFLFLLPFPIISCLQCVSSHVGFNLIWFCLDIYFTLLLMLLWTCVIIIIIIVHVTKAFKIFYHFNKCKSVKQEISALIWRQAIKEGIHLREGHSKMRFHVSALKSKSRLSIPMSSSTW